MRANTCSVAASSLGAGGAAAIELLEGERTEHRPLRFTPRALRDLGLDDLEGAEVLEAEGPEQPPGAGRPAARIPVVLDRIAAAWERHPDMRLGQLLLSLTPPVPNPLFDLEEPALAVRLEELIRTGRWSRFERPKDERGTAQGGDPDDNRESR